MQEAAALIAELGVAPVKQGALDGVCYSSKRTGASLALHDLISGVAKADKLVA